MTLVEWFSLLLICTLGAISPGPSLAVVLRQTLSNDRKHGLLTAWSHALGVGLWALLTVVGLGLIVQQQPLLFKAITYLGAAYLIWLGIKSIRSEGTTTLKTEDKKSTYLQACRDGFSISLLNPKLAVFFLALFSQFITAENGVTEQLIMITTVTITDGLWYSLIALMLSHSSVTSRLSSRSNWINRLLGITFIGLGLRIITL